ncbi:hypothetical protein K525DRAFT_274379 [Schizophyllum commune Loenen D]|nr:hypothetical protein K525DRAFT_274379 [Schizophyllum commune Loenen D]
MSYSVVMNGHFPVEESRHAPRTARKPSLRAVVDLLCARWSTFFLITSDLPSPHHRVSQPQSTPARLTAVDRVSPRRRSTLARFTAVDPSSPHRDRPSLCAASTDLFLDTIAGLFLATIADLFLATIADLFLDTIADLFRAASNPSSHRHLAPKRARYTVQALGLYGLAAPNTASLAAQNTVGLVSGNTIAPIARVQTSGQSTMQTFGLSTVQTLELSAVQTLELSTVQTLELSAVQTFWLSYRCSRIDAGALVFVSLQTPGHPGSVWNSLLSGSRFVENGDPPSAIGLAGTYYMDEPQRLVLTCARTCIALDDFDFLFEDLFGHYDDAGIRRIFLRELEPFMLEGEIKDHAAGRSLACS